MIHVQTIAVQCKSVSSGSTQLAPCVCLGVCGIKQARMRTTMHTERLWRPRHRTQLMPACEDVRGHTF